MTFYARAEILLPLKQGTSLMQESVPEIKCISFAKGSPIDIPQMFFEKWKYI